MVSKINGFNKESFIKLLDNLFFRVFVLVVPVIVVAVFIPKFLKKESLVLYPNNKDFSNFCFTDIDGGGISEIKKISDDSSGYKFTYTLKKGIEVPYAGFTIAPKVKNSTIDVSKYSFFKIAISASSGKNINFFLRTSIPEFTKNEDSKTHCFYQYELPLSSDIGKGIYLVNFEDLKIPYWWFEVHKWSIHQKPKETWSEVLAFDIESGVSLPYETADTVTIKEVSIHKKASYSSFIIFVISYYVIILLLFLYKKFTETKKQVVIPYTELPARNEDQNECAKVVKFIADNYQESDLTVDKISKGSRVSALKIPVFIRKQFNCTVPEYLNTIRITEAKRLLEHSDMQIISIALAVGYNNVSHFNRKFKSLQEMSPLAYRKSKKR